MLAAGTLVLATVAVCAALPSWAETKTEGALVAVERRATPEQLRDAQADADFASRIDPVSYEPLLAASTLADRRGRSAQARGYLMDAIRRAPDSLVVWLAVARFELERGDAANVRDAMRHALRLDPRNRAASAILGVEQLSSVRPGASPTATGTPLVAVVGQTPATRGLLAPGQTPGSAP
jgi:cytochrome c-type biogenesis protein CcmH/NrfG